MSAIVAELGSLFLQVRGGSSLRARLARATGWMAVGTGLQSGCAVLAGIAAARILGPAAFGGLGMVRLTLVVLANLGGSGLGIATTRCVAALRIAEPERAGLVIGALSRVSWVVGGAAGGVCLLFAHPIAVHLLASAGLSLPLAVSALAVVLAIAGAVQLGVLAGCESFSLAAAMVAFEGVMTSALLVLGAWIHGVLGAVAGYTIGTAAALLLKQRQVALVCRRAAIPVSTRGARAELPVLARFVLPSMFLGLATPPAEWFVRALLALPPNGLSEVGIFTAAYSWAQLVLFLPGQIAGTTLPIATNCFASGDFRTFRQLCKRTCGVVLGAGLAVAIPIAAASPWIMRAYGHRFASGAIVLATMALAYAVGSTTMVFRMALLASGRAWTQAGHAVTWSVVLIASFLLSRGDGARGLAMSHGIAFLVLVTVQAIVLRRVGGRHEAAPYALEVVA